MKRVPYILVFLSVLLLTVPAEAFQLFGIQQEIELGLDMASELEKEYGIYYDETWTNLLAETGMALATNSARPDLPYRFKILDSDEINALALPGGYIYVYRGLLEITDDVHQIAAVLSHEIAHVANRHGMQALERNLGITLGVTLLFRVMFRGEPTPEILEQATSMGMHLFRQGYSRENEFDADQTGVKLMSEAGYDPYGMIRLLQQLAALNNRHPNKLEVLFNSHPPTNERIERVEQYIATNL